MVRYIDADKLRETSSTWMDGNVLVMSVQDVDNAPTADVVEVVRCKDCKHATFYTCKNDACYKGILCEYRIGIGDENFFCSLGERRTDNDL